MTNPAQSITTALILALSMPFLGTLHAADSNRDRATVSEALPHYQPKALVKGTIEVPITDSLTDLGDEWTRGFRRYHPDSKLVFLPKLSAEAVKPLLAGTSRLVVLSREINASEAQVFQTRFGYLPIRIPVCIDTNIVFVNRDNPITSISMEQLDAIYSKSRLGGASMPALVWGDLGVKGDLARRTINAYTRADGTALRSSIGSMVLLGGEFRSGILSCQDNAELAEAVSMDPAAIAIGAMASWFSTNKTLPVVPYRGSEARFPTQENVTSSKYPMPRLYFAYLNRAPGKPVDPVVGEVMNFVLSQEGQNQVADAGLLPGPPEFITINLKRLNR